ncbi:polysaccharide pyruvyl transferase family protein [Micrococcus sp. KBS0714]|nr:polysaccharide pyruvyl transferase family protein [Micrococcus sp. KBS0714]
MRSSCAYIRSAPLLLWRADALTGSPQLGRSVKILVYGAVHQQPNIGVSALAAGAEAVLSRAFPDADIRFRSTGPLGDGPMNLSHTAPLLKEMVVNRRGLRGWTRSFDLLCDIRGGDSFTDIYTSKMFFKLSAFPLYAQALRVPVVMLPQTIGPFENRASRILAKRFMRGCRLVMARDPRSSDFAAELGRPVDLTATDVVFAIERPEPSLKHRDVVLNTSGLLWHAGNRHVDSDAYRAGIRGVIDILLAEGRQITLLAHVVGRTDTGADNDRAALAALREDYGDRLEYVVPSGLDEVRSLMASANVVVGARMHACLNALSIGVPAVPMAYSRKFAPLLDQLGWHHTVDLNASGEQIATAVLEEIHAVEGEDLTPVLRTARARIDAAVEALRQLSD